MGKRRPGRALRYDGEGGVAEDPDFDERFRRQRARRWARGVRNGINLASLIRFRLGLSDTVHFRGVAVQMSENQATYRLVEDIWMRGEYDIPGYVPEPGWQVVDIGANVGIFDMLAASRGARVRSYEPGLAAFQRLRANTAKWDVECHNEAVVGEPRSSVRLFIHPLRDTRNTMFGDVGGVDDPSGDRPGGPSFETAVDVSTIHVRDVLAEPCDLLKVACEGAEFEIIAHAGDSLRNAKRIILELHTAMDTEHGNADDLVHTVREAGFETRLEPPLCGVNRQFMTAILR